jgi:hypothetical protein
MDYYRLINSVKEDIYSIYDGDKLIMVLLYANHRCYQLKATQKRGNKVLNIPENVKQKAIKTCLEKSNEI